ncbi:MAG: leucyl-tRNA synthetase [Parcubacteria group bacterium]|nr:leucyl-tRNA synthetase [Parcubacteria group bacterium]
MARESYNHSEIEPWAQKKWDDGKIYEVDLTDQSKEPYYLLNEFPYPSGDLHVGHWYAFAITDIFARFKRMQGKNLLFPIGFDAFGLPAENAAIKRGLDPKKWTYENMDVMRTQMRTMGGSFDWSKEVVTCSPEYYKWTQWLFSRLYEHELAERKEAPVKWCPHDQTVLANEQVVDGKCERCGHEVEERILTQWFFSITKYADRLLTDLEGLPWKEEIKSAQREWIGKSEGAKLAFTLSFKKNPSDNDWRDEDGKPAQLAVFTTRPDTLFGVTYLVLAPEHPWVTAALDGEHDVLTNESAVRAYVEETKKKTELERMENKEKTGVALEGIMAIHPLTKEEIPVYVADYVLGSYGTGAVMAVPAHDERDFEFAKKFDLPIKPVVSMTVINEHNPPVEGKPNTKRNVIHAILRNPADDTYLVGFLKDESWGDRKPVNFVIGGVDQGEDWAEAAAREIREETGYTDIVLEQEVGLPINAYFYQAQKEVNRDSDVRTFVFTLKSDEKEETDAEEKSKHDFKWLTADEVTAQLNVPSDQIIWRFYQSGGFATGEHGRLVNSGDFTGRDSNEAMWDIVAAAGGERTINFRLRDWLVSRQRYWGCPIPVVYDPEGNAHLIPSEHLPWLLPEDVDFTPSGVSPLATSEELKDRVTGIFGEGWTPEYDTLDTFVDSSWYFMRYLAPNDDTQFSNADLMKKWLPVNRYSGGSEHTTMHLLYSRFFYKAMYDLALVPTAEPFYERFNRGLIMGPDGQKMSKSKGNVINPDEVVAKFGADAVRTYLSFIGPYNEPGNYPWKPEGIEAMRRFLDRCYALRTKVSDTPATEEEQKALAKAALKIGTDIERFKLNTAVSALMILVNALEDAAEISKDGFGTFLRLLAPFAPHLADHLYSEILKSEDSIHTQDWPTFDERLLSEDMVIIGVQVAGKRRGEVSISPSASEEEAVLAALSDANVQKAMPNGQPSRVIYIPGKILNLIP